MPKYLTPGVLYVSREFNATAHICPCGCGKKIRTPIGPTDWDLEETVEGPSLYPSVGNWQQPCKSHYWIYRGNIIWADEWTQDEIMIGRSQEEAKHRRYYSKLYRKQGRFHVKIAQWIKQIFSRNKRAK